MNAQKATKKRNIFIMTAAVIVLLTIAAVIFLYFFPKERRSDYKRLSSESYDTVFLSMYPVDYFYEEDFTYYRGMNIVKASYTIPSFATLESYMDVIARSGNTISTIYLGVLPDELPSDELAVLLQSYPGVHFEIILPNPSLDYWLELSETECTAKLEAYRDFTLPLLQYENMAFYFFGAEEWLIANPANYCDVLLTSETASRTIMLNADQGHSYLLTVDKLEEDLDTLSALIADNRSHAAENTIIQDYQIIFLGDSVIGNFSGSTSIPGVVEGLTNAQVYNFGIGGGCATDSSENISSLPDIVNALIYRDTSYLSPSTEYAQNVALTEDIAAYLEYSETETPENLCFVINYGLNDYFSGCLIASEDSYDVHTYAGAIRTSMTALQEAYPDAPIILATPNFTSYFGNGTEYREGASHTLEDYANAVISLSEELHVELVDNFNELDINAENHFQYLSDGCHPNETGRFLMGQRIAAKLAEFLTK